jgi:hypothetical protein
VRGHLDGKLVGEERLLGNAEHMGNAGHGLVSRQS